MPRYYFDVIDGGLIVDDEGLDLANLETARDKALRALPDIAKSLLFTENEREVSITMRNESGTPLFEATLTIKARWLTDVA